MSKLVIARFKNDIIHISQYQDILHKGEIYCPFCNPPLLLEHNILGFFKAWRNRGGHNCRNINVNYFDADWEGKQYVEIMNDNDGNMNITIDINTIAKPISHGNSTGSVTSGGPTDELRFPKHEHKEKVFREVITSVYQMKRLIEKNEFSSLKKLNYYFKIEENEPLNFNEVVYKCNEIGSAPHNKRRFCIFDVEKINIDQEKGKIYINSYSRNNCKIVGVLKAIPGLKEKLPNLRKKFQGQFVIAFGRILKSQRENNKVYLDLSNDFCIVKLNDNDVEYLFRDSEKQPFVYSPKKEDKDSKKEQYAVCTNSIRTINHVNGFVSKEPIKSVEILQPSNEIQRPAREVSIGISSTTEQKENNKTTIIENDSFINKLKQIFTTFFN
jgi:hypothetical protein